MPTWSRGSLGMVLKDRVALVTGGGTGIGLAIALAFLREGARVAIGSRNPVHVKEGSEAARAAGHEVLPLQLDVTDPASVHGAVGAMVSRYGRIDILVNNAGASGIVHQDIDPAVTAHHRANRAVYRHRISDIQLKGQDFMTGRAGGLASLLHMNGIPRP